MTAFLRKAQQSEVVIDRIGTGRHLQKQLVGPVPPPQRRWTADCLPTDRPGLPFHDRLQEGKTLRKRAAY
jgi:hypothetical protein